MAELISKLEIGVSEELSAALRDAAETIRELTSEVINLRQEVRCHEERLDNTRRELLDELWTLEKRLDQFVEEN